MNYNAALAEIPVIKTPLIPDMPVNDIGEPERQDLIKRIKLLLKEKNAVIIAHYYTDKDIQWLAEETGGHVSDSLDMARFGNQHPASTLVVAGVRFMGETAKILNPEKTILMPTLKAECSLDLSCPPDAFARFCDQHPDRTVVVYANTSVEVKARADWVVTSSNAIKVVEHLMDEGEKILWAPDRHLGNHIQSITDADMLIWQGACVVHESFKAKGLEKLKPQYPDAAVLVHPESPAAVIEMADVVGSTTRLLEAAQELPNKTFIVATDNGIFYKMSQLSPDKEFISAPTGGRGATCLSCAHCPWMAMNNLRNLANILETEAGEVIVSPDIAHRALKSTKRMLDFGA